MAKKRKLTIGGCLFEFIKWIFIIAFWPISLMVYIAKWQKKQKQKLQEPRITVEIHEHGQVVKSVAESNKFTFTRQLQETKKLLNETNNISTLFSKAEFLMKLRKSVSEWNSREEGFSDILLEVNSEVQKIDEYINLFILRQVATIDDDAVNVTPATTRRRFKKLYQRLDAYKSNMKEDDICMYTNICQQRLEVDTLALPTYSKLLTRLNNSALGCELPQDYYIDHFNTQKEAVQFLKQKGYLTVSEDNKKYALTELGTQETGWL